MKMKIQYFVTQKQHKCEECGKTISKDSVAVNIYREWTFIHVNCFESQVELPIKNKDIYVLIGKKASEKLKNNNYFSQKSSIVKSVKGVSVYNEATGKYDQMSYLQHLIKSEINGEK